MPAEHGDARAWRPALARSVVLRHDRVRRAELLLMPERAVLLNDEGGRIVRLCDGRRTVADIVAALAPAHPGAPLGDDVPEFLDRKFYGWALRNRAALLSGGSRRRSTPTAAPAG